MQNKTKLVELHLEDSFSKCKDVIVKEINYQQYCRLKKDINTGNASFNQINKGVQFNWNIKKMINL